MHVRLGGLRGGGVHIFEQLIDLTSGDAAASVGNLHGDVLLALHDRHFDRRDVSAVLVRLHHGAHRVLEQLEQNVVEMRWHIDNPDGLALFKLCETINQKAFEGLMTVSRYHYVRESPSRALQGSTDRTATARSRKHR